jgi:ABC-type lipoprotein export system ATPase subunit
MGNLPVHRGEEVMALFPAHGAGHTILLITHNPDVAAVAGRRPPARRRRRRRGAAA